MNSLISLLCGILFVYPIAQHGDRSTTENSYVRAEIAPKPARLKAGSSGEIRIVLAPAKGIHINLNPPIEVKLDSSALQMVSVGKLDIPTQSAAPYLDPSKPIRLAFTVAENHAAGHHFPQGHARLFLLLGRRGLVQPVQATD